MRFIQRSSSNIISIILLCVQKSDTSGPVSVSLAFWAELNNTSVSASLEFCFNFSRDNQGTSFSSRFFKFLFKILTKSESFSQDSVSQPNVKVVKRLPEEGEDQPIISTPSQPPQPQQQPKTKTPVPRQNSSGQSGGEEYFSTASNPLSQTGSQAGSQSGSQAGSQYASPVNSPPASAKQSATESSDGTAEVISFWINGNL